MGWRTAGTCGADPAARAGRIGGWRARALHSAPGARGKSRRAAGGRQGAADHVYRGDHLLVRGNADHRAGIHAADVRRSFGADRWRG